MFGWPTDSRRFGDSLLNFNVRHNLFKREIFSALELGVILLDACVYGVFIAL
jgi:hypothetical protein